MQSIEKSLPHSVTTVLTDIDDTLTDDGKLEPEAYQALWDLHRHGLRVIPVTGRPAGWCEMIARVWPVHSVIGENGAFYFRLQDQVMRRRFFGTGDQKRLLKVFDELKFKFPDLTLSSDQFARSCDLAIDICEDRQALSTETVQHICAELNAMGLQFKVSSIHINAWFGEYNKLTATLALLKDEFGLKDNKEVQTQVAFIGDSPNDSPLFEHFDFSYGVQNFKDFENLSPAKPKFITKLPRGLGFVEFARHLISCRS